MKRTIRLSESDIRRMVVEAVEDIVSGREGGEYTMSDWDRDGSFNAKEGQVVADDVIDELAGAVPPTTWKMGVFQTGEAYTHDWNTGEALYQTFEKRGSGWVYVGIQPER